SALASGMEWIDARSDRDPDDANRAAGWQRPDKMSAGWLVTSDQYVAFVASQALSDWTWGYVAMPGSGRYVIRPGASGYALHPPEGCTDVDASTSSAAVFNHQDPALHH